VIEEIFGTMAMVTSIISLLPQIYKAAKTHSTSDISMCMLVNYAVCSVCWIVYGMLSGGVFVVWSNAFCGITSIISICQKRKYDKMLHKI
jgi:MtN3 and saliva related transmembrane protein